MEHSFEVDENVEKLLQQESVVAIGVSGGKDSTACAVHTVRYLKSRNYAGYIILVHADLGDIEWKESLPVCQRLADRLGLNLLVVKRKSGGLLERWEQRWQVNVQRYINLECVKLILPWSTPSMRFCTSELKTEVICQALTRNFPGKKILSVTGVRCEESNDRKNTPVSSPQPRLTKKRLGTEGLNWNPIRQQTLQQVLELHRTHNLPLHEAYTRYGSSRVSCMYCIMSNASDLRAALRCLDNHTTYRRICALEIQSAFSFQSSGWLSDLKPELLTLSQQAALYRAKLIARQRDQLEARLPKHLLFHKGWPSSVPSMEDARLLASIRKRIGHLMGFTMQYTTPIGVALRYHELLQNAQAVKPR